MDIPSGLREAQAASRLGAPPETEAPWTSNGPGHDSPFDSLRSLRADSLRPSTLRPLDSLRSLGDASRSGSHGPLRRSGPRAYPAAPRMA